MDKTSLAPPHLHRAGLGPITPESVYGTILVNGILVAAGAHDLSSWATFTSVVVTVIVFWVAHVYADTVAEHGVVEGDPTTLGTAFRRAVRRSMGFLISALIPSCVLLLGALERVSDSRAIWIALWLGVLNLAVIGYQAFALRGSSWPVRVLGCLGTAAFGLAAILLKALMH